MRAYAKVFYISLGCFLFTSGGVPGQTNVPAVCKEMKTQREMNECLASAYGDADRDLNALYASVKARLDPVAIGNLQVAQRAWIRYRDSDCEAEAGLYEGGSIQPAVRSGCLERVTRARIAELHVIYDTGTR